MLYEFSIQAVDQVGDLLLVSTPSHIGFRFCILTDWPCFHRAECYSLAWTLTYHASYVPPFQPSLAFSSSALDSETRWPHELLSIHENPSHWPWPDAFSLFSSQSPFWSFYNSLLSIIHGCILLALLYCVREYDLLLPAECKILESGAIYYITWYSSHLCLMYSRYSMAICSFTDFYELKLSL